jgi:hypothetical protein
MKHDYSPAVGAGMDKQGCAGNKKYRSDKRLTSGQGATGQVEGTRAYGIRQRK